MEQDIKTISSPFGKFTRGENGLIYFYKIDDLSIDKQTAEKFVEIINQLDIAVAPKVIVIQGQRVEYSFEAQRILLASGIFAKVAYVIETSSQQITAELLQDIAKTFRSSTQVRTFSQIEEAEAWLLES
jgi:ERCC4-type nuclease